MVLVACGKLAKLASTGTSNREKQYQAHRAFGDRREGVISARTYFYTNEAKCDCHMETFLRCIEALGEPLTCPASGGDAGRATSTSS